MSEITLQKAVVQHLKFRSAPGVIWFHVPNSARRAPRSRGFYASLGIIAGVADLVIVLPGGKAHFLELKTETGRVSKEQRAFREACLANRTPYEIARNIDEAVSILSAWGVFDREPATQLVEEVEKLRRAA